MTQPKLVLFDCDGVLVDTELAGSVGISKNLAGYGLHLTPMECRDHFVGGSLESVRDKARAMGATLADDWTKEISEAMLVELRKGVDLIDGIIPVLDGLDAAGVAYCVVSNGPMHKMEVTLKPSGMWDRMAGKIYSAYTVGAPKPDPKMLLQAATDFGVSPDDCVMIDDSPSGCRAAKNANMRCIGFDEIDKPERLAAEGAEVISHMRDLPRKLGLT